VLLVRKTLNIIEDTTPQLGGNLDGQAYTITTTAGLYSGAMNITRSSNTFVGMAIANAMEGNAARAGFTIASASSSGGLVVFDDGYATAEVAAKVVLFSDASAVAFAIQSLTNFEVYTGGAAAANKHLSIDSTGVTAIAAPNVTVTGVSGSNLMTSFVANTARSCVVNLSRGASKLGLFRFQVDGVNTCYIGDNVTDDTLTFAPFVDGSIQTYVTTFDYTTGDWSFGGAITVTGTASANLVWGGNVTSSGYVYASGALTARGITILGDALNNTTVSATGDMTFTGTGGLAYGCIDGTNESVVCTTQNTWYQVTFDTAGPVNLVEADTTNNELQISVPGVYNVSVTACLHSAVASDFELMVKKTDGTVDLAPHLFQTTAVANKVENTAGSCLVDLTTVSDRVELWVRCTSAAAKTAIFDHVTLSLLMVGGT